MPEAEQFAVLHGNEQKLPWIILNCDAFGQLIAEQPIQAHVSAGKQEPGQLEGNGLEMGKVQMLEN